MVQTQIPEDLLGKLKQLPDGTATTNEQLWFQTWASWTQKQIASGKIKIYDVPEYDPETGMVPNAVIEQIAMKNRKLN